MTQVASKRRDRQVVRILGILGALLEGGQPTIRQLATRFGTRRETIYRDLRALENAGYPISGDEAGRLSRPRLLPELRRAVPGIRLSDAEIEALLWATKQAGQGSPFRSTLNSAATKLRAMASQDQAKIAAGIDQVVAEHTWGVKDYEPHRGTIVRLVEAIVRRRRCEVVYRAPSSSRSKTYRYDPYQLVTVAGGLYCIGRVPHHEGLTTLAVDRVVSMHMLDEKFEIDREFDAERYRRESFGVIWEKPMNVTIRFRADQAPYVREREWHPTQRIRDLPDGRIELSFRAGGAFEIMRWVLAWGDAAEMVRPRSLRAKIEGALKLAVRSYETD